MLSREVENINLIVSGWSRSGLDPQKGRGAGIIQKSNCIQILLNNILGLFILVQERGNTPHVVSKNIRKQYNWF
jgi:hypothetical protein